jgi:hypothetical protein
MKKRTYVSMKKERHQRLLALPGGGAWQAEGRQVKPVL